MTIYDPQNIFAKIIRGEIPCKKVYEDEYALAFEDIAPDAPLHVLVVPKAGFTSFNDFAAQAPVDVVRGFFTAVQKVAAQLGLEEGGYRLITNHGSDAAQSVAHFHMHILGGVQMGKLLP